MKLVPSGGISQTLLCLRGYHFLYCCSLTSFLRFAAAVTKMCIKLAMNIFSSSFFMVIFIMISLLLFLEGRLKLLFFTSHFHYSVSDASMSQYGRECGKKRLLLYHKSNTDHPAHSHKPEFRRKWSWPICRCYFGQKTTQNI